MPSELVAYAVREGGMKFVATVGDHSVTFDYPLRPEEAVAGPTPLQMLLASLAVCAGSTVGLLLERMKQPFAGLAVEAKGTRADQHPTVLTNIDLVFTVRGPEIEADKVERALTMAETQLCPVWAMLRPCTPIKATYRLTAD